MADVSDPTIWLLDGDFRRRAAIVHLLLGSNFHVEPFESVGELVNAAPKNPDAILAYHHENTVASLLEDLAEQTHFFPVIVYHEEPVVERVVEAMRNGVDYYLCWPWAAIEVVKAIEVVAASASRSMRHARSRGIAARAQLKRLTAREREVLAGLVNGLSNRGIAEVLQISPRTVEIHRGNLLRKIDAHSAEAIRLAIEADLLEYC